MAKKSKRQVELYEVTIETMEEIAPEWCETHGARAAWVTKVAEESSRSD